MSDPERIDILTVALKRLVRWGESAVSAGVILSGNRAHDREFTEHCIANHVELVAARQVLARAKEGTEANLSLKDMAAFRDALLRDGQAMATENARLRKQVEELQRHLRDHVELDQR